MNKPYDYLERISMCSARMWQGGLKRSLVVSLSLEDTVKSLWRGFPGGSVVKNPPANAEDTGSSLGPGRSHMPQSN